MRPFEAEGGNRPASAEPAVISRLEPIPPTAPTLRIGFRLGQYPALSETFIGHQVRGMVCRGHAVSVLADEPGHDGSRAIARPPGLAAVRYIEPQSELLARAHRQLPYRLRRRRALDAERHWSAGQDVVLCHFGWSGLKMAESLRAVPSASRPRLAVVFHGDDMSRMLVENGSDVYAPLFDLADLLLPVSAFWRERLIALGAPPEKVVTHHMGVELADHAFRLRYPPQDQPLDLVSVGRLVEKKGTEVTLKALAHFRDTRGTLPFVLRIFGGGPLDGELQALTDFLGLSDCVRFEGSQPHDVVRAALAEASAFVLPSRTAADGDMEGIPVVLMEAMASGLPVITTDHSGISELVQHEETGLLAPEDDVPGLADQLERMLADPAAARQRAERARKAVETHFNNAALNERLERLLALSAGRGDPAGATAFR